MFAAAKQKTPAALRLVAVAALVGAAAGLGAILFWSTVSWMQGVVFPTGPQGLQTALADLPWWLLISVPTLGGLAIGLFVHFLMLEQRPHGVADVIEAAALRGSRMPLRNGLYAALVSAASIGCGASVGREGPIVHLGATLGSWIARTARIPAGQLRRLLGCGVAAGIAASFNAPIAGAIFAIEVVIGKYTFHAFAPIAISTVIGTYVSQLYYGSEPAFSLPVHGATSLGDIPVYALLGVVSALTAIALLSCVSLARLGFERVACPQLLRPAVAGLLVGLLATATPQVLGVGYATTNAVLHETLPWTVITLLLLTKLLASGISLGGGFGGGIFSPSLFIGAMCGGSFGILWEQLVAHSSGGYSGYTIVGMGAVAGAVLGAPLSTTLIVFEMTGDYPLTIAVMLAVIISSIIVNDFFGRSFFSWQLAQRNIDLTYGPTEQLMSGVRVAEVMDTDFVAIPESADAAAIRQAMSAGKPVFVEDADGRYVGVIAIPDLEQSADAAAADIVRRVTALHSSTNLVDAIGESREADRTGFAVLSDDDEGKIVGHVSVKRLLNVYQDILDRQAREERSFGE